MPNCDHLKSFFNFIPSEADLNTCGIKLLEEKQANVDLSIETSVVQHELNPILHKEQQTTESLLNNDNNLPEWKKVPIVPSDLDIDNVPKTTISAIFSEAESLLNEKGAITKAASNDERLRTVKDKTSVQPFIVAPSSRNRDFLTCKCKTFVWYNFRVHLVAVACELNIWFDYFVKVRKKHRNNVGKRRGVSSAIEYDLSAKEKGMKKDEIRKNATSKQKKPFNQAENDHRQHFQENTSSISKSPISTNQDTISLTQPNPRIDYSPFTYLQSLTQSIPSDQIQHKASHLKVSRHL